MVAKKLLLFFRDVADRIKKFDVFFVFLACLFLFTLLQLHPTFPDPDSFYHARIASMMASGPVINFPWLPLTTLAHSFIDHHFLYHILLIPFVSLFDPLIGLKIATTLFASGFLTLFYLLLRSFPGSPKLSKSQALFFLCFLALNTMFMFRLNLGKIPAVSLFVFFCGLYAISKTRLRTVFGLSFLFVWLYGGWPLLPFAATIGWIARSLSCNEKKEEIASFFKNLLSWNNLSLPLASFSGALCGLIINPYFPTNIYFYWIQTFKIAVLNVLSNIPVGAEWYPAGITFVPSHGPTLILLVFALCAFILPGIFNSYGKESVKKRTWQQWMLCALTLIFLFLTLKSRRYGEYFAPIATLFCAQILESFMHRAQLTRFYLFIKKNLSNIFSFKGIVALYFIIIAPAVITTNILQVITVYQDGYTFNQYKQGMKWLIKNTPDHSLVFHNRWDDFPLFFYQNKHNQYISGLDPRFLLEKNSDLAKKYADLTDGSDFAELYGFRSACLSTEKGGEQKKDHLFNLPSSCIPTQEKKEMENSLKKFNATYIVATHLDEPFNEKVRGIPGLTEAYSDKEMVIYSASLR